MPKVTSLELSQELARVAKEHGEELPESEMFYGIIGKETPAYQTDELLDWLPGDTWLGNVSKKHFAAVWWDYQELGETPADALCKLAIAGIKEGWIK